MLFIKHIRRGLTPEDAAMRVKKFLFDYSNLAPAEKAFFRRVIPFWTFFRRNVPLQVETLLTNPGRIAIQSKILQERVNEQNRLSMQYVNGSWIRTNKQGDELTVVSGVDLPWKQLHYFDVLTGNTKRTRELGGMVAPLIKMPIEYTMGGDIYSGQKFGRKQYGLVGKFIDTVGMPKGVKDWIGYIKRTDPAGRPIYEFDYSKMYFLLDAWALSRVMRTSDNIFKSMVNGSDNNLLQKFLTATETKKLDLNAEEQKRLKERTDLINQELIKRGVLQENTIRSAPTGVQGY